MNRRTSVSSGSVESAVRPSLPRQKARERRHTDRCRRHALRRIRRRDRFATTTSAFAAEMIGDSPRSDLNQPAARIVRETLLRPLQRGGKQRLLHGVLSSAEVAEATDHRAENLRCQFAQQVLVGELRRSSRHTSTGGALITSRTSIGMLSGAPPLPGAADASAAI